MPFLGFVRLIDCDTRGFFTSHLFIWCSKITYDVFNLVQFICPSSTFHVRSFVVSICSYSSFLDFPLRDQTCLMAPSSVAYKHSSLYLQFLNSNSVAPLFVSRTASKRKQINFRFCSANHTFEKSKLTRIASDRRIQIVYDMAQPANKLTPLRIDAFWDKPAPDPPLRWGKMESAIQIGTARKG